MEFNQSQKRMFILLGVVIIFAAYMVISEREKYLSYYFGQAPAPAKIENKQPASVSNPDTVDKKEYTKNWGKDPFRDKKTVVVAKTKKVNKRSATRFRLKAISYKGANSVALINNSVVKIGDTITGYRVTNINPDRVVLSRNSKRIVLNLK